MTLQNLNKYRIFIIFISFAQTKTAFSKEKVPNISIEVGCQVSHVGRHIEEPAVFVSAVVHIFVTAHIIRFPKTRQHILLRLLWMTSFVWDAEVVEHLLLLARTSVGCCRRIILDTSLSE